MENIKKNETKYILNISKPLKNQTFDPLCP